MLLKKLFIWPSKNLAVVIPIILIVGFTVGYFYDTQYLKKFILSGTFLMILPTMIGFKLKEAFDLSHFKVLFTAMIINFVAIPLVAYGLGITFLSGEPEIFAGLAIAALLPTSGMTISWTMLNKGNVPAAIKITTVSLLTGALVAPWYLLAMVGQLVDVNVKQIFMTIALIIILPLFVGTIIYNLLMIKMTPQEFKEKVKPFLPAFSVWALMFVIFTSISMKARMIMKSPGSIVAVLIVLVIFYFLTYLISTITGRILMERKNAITLVYGTVMRNLSLALGLAVTTFGPKAALIVTLAFILQVQSAVWYGYFSKRFGFFKEKDTDILPS